MPNVAGMDVGSATAALTAAGFTPIQGGTSFSTYPPGRVAFTTPGGFCQAPRGQRGHDHHFERPRAAAAADQAADEEADDQGRRRRSSKPPVEGPKVEGLAATKH